MSYTGSVPDTEPAIDWREFGACASHNAPDIWYSTGGSNEGRAEQREAQAICYGCPVIQQCGQWALETQEPWGTWGGMTDAQRRRVLRRRARVEQAASAPVPAKSKVKRQPAKCGTRGGYQKHLREKTVICGPCRQANTDADNRLRRTGTTKALAS
jgi:hypothetical protein